MANSAPLRLLRLPEVISTTGLSRASIYNYMAEGKFPPSVSIGARAVAWPSNDVTQWVSDRISATRKTVGA